MSVCTAVRLESHALRGGMYVLLGVHAAHALVVLTAPTYRATKASQVANMNRSKMWLPLQFATCVPSTVSLLWWRPLHCAPCPTTNKLVQHSY